MTSRYKRHYRCHLINETQELQEIVCNTVESPPISILALRLLFSALPNHGMPFDLIFSQGASFLPITKNLSSFSAPQMLIGIHITQQYC